MAKLGGTRRGAFRAYFFGYFVCISGFLFGYDTGIGGVLTLKSYMHDFHYTDETTVDAVMVSVQNAAAFFAAISIFPVSDRFGRKRVIQAACAVFCLGVILQVIPSHSLACYYVGRIIAGSGLGAATAISPCYNAETAPKEIRGKLGSGMQWLFALGVMISYWIVYATDVSLPVSSAQWQIPVGLQLVPPTVLALGLCFQRESFRWLAKQGRNEEAWDNLCWMRADDGPEVRAEFEEIKTGIALERQANEGYRKREILEPANRYRLLLAFGLFLGQQCTGQTALAYFGPQFFSTLVGSGSRDLLITGLFGAEKFITNGIYILFVSERWNRKPTLWISAILMACCFVVVNVVNKTTPTPTTGHVTSSGIATVAMVFITNSIYQFSWGPLPWPYTAEIFPSRLRATGTSVAVGTQWLFNFLFSLTTPYMIAAWGSYVFTFYAILDIIMATLVFLFVKETKGKSIEEMETIFHSRAEFDVETARWRGMNKSVDEERRESVDVTVGDGGRVGHVDEDVDT